MEGNAVSVERVVPAPASAIFDILTDVSRHPEIDGSGSVRKVKGDPPDRLCEGSVFGMSMHVGVNYSMVNTVIEFEKDHRIAWRSGPRGFLGNLFAGRVWRYELEQVEGGTLVRETWDISGDHQRALLRRGKLPEQTRSNMEKTLARIEELTVEAK
jgi:hypothetical protein